MPAPNISIIDVARILQLIATAPHARRQPRKSDRPGDFDIWFDGGAVKIFTGTAYYLFDDGTTAGTVTSPGINFSITFPGGRQVDVVERRAADGGVLAR